MNKFLIQEYIFIIFYCWGTWLTPLACKATLDLWTWGKEEKERKKMGTHTCHALQWPSLACKEIEQLPSSHSCFPSFYWKYNGG